MKHTLLITFSILALVLSANAQKETKTRRLSVSVCGDSDSKTAADVIDALKVSIRSADRYELSSNCSDEAEFRVVIVSARVGNGATETGAALSVAFVGGCVATAGAMLMPLFAPEDTLRGDRIPYYLGSMALIEPYSASHGNAAVRILGEMQHALETH